MSNFNETTGQDAPAANAVEITPSDTAVLNPVVRALWIGGAGNVRVVTVSGQTVTFAGAQAGSIIPVRVRQVLATGTTATSIDGLW